MTTTSPINKDYFTNKIQVFNFLMHRDSQFNVSGVFSEIMEKADMASNFVGDILENAVCYNKSISEKQAWCVAFFADKNGFVKA